MGFVVVAGGHGQIALKLYANLGRDGRGLIRNPEHQDDVRAAGGEPVVFDLESDDELASHVEGAEAVVFAAGAGPGSGAKRKETVDLGAAVKLIRACEATGVKRYLMVSAMGAADPSAGAEEMQPYLRAKAGADEALQDSDLDFTIVRPGRLTDAGATGTVAVGERLDYGEVTRADVALVLAACLDIEETIGKTFDLVGGDAPITEALRSL